MASLIQVDAPMTSGWKSLTQPLLDYGEFVLACRSIDMYVRANAGSAAARFDQALIYTQSARPRRALAILDSIGNELPDRASCAYLRGTIALNLGEREMAREALLEANDARPSSGQILQTLTMIGSMASEPLVADRILAAEQPMQGADAADRAPYLYALGKTLDDLGEVERSFAAFEAGAALVARERPYDAALDRQNAVEATLGWNAESIAKVSGGISVPTDRPIIVTGLPRSGSTLVEQILVSHSAVADGDELARFALVTAEVGGTTAAALAEYAGHHAPVTASRFYQHLLAQRFGKDGRIVDKTLEASRYLGTLAALMPEAPILWMRRDPLDNAWSCFHTWFLAGLPWSWAQEALAYHLALEDALLKQWQAILGRRIFVVHYEKLVTEKETMIPQILAHCGLAVEPQVFSPEQTKRLVTTASMTQVRAPINDRAVHSAQRYRKHLQPFIDAYGYEG